jgi:aldehyde:ferredoxin oxidoreductase
LVTAATGREISLPEFLQVGERIWNLERLYNLGAGLSRADDMLPERCFEPIQGEASEGAVMDRGEFEKMLGEYYRLRGWDEGGIPTRKKLRGLGIPEYADLAKR